MQTRCLFLMFLAGCSTTSNKTPAVAEDGGLDCGDGVAVVGYADVDGDGYGTPNERITVCDELPEGYAPSSEDCDDNDTGIHPNATEYCDGADNDCDAETDEDAVDQRTHYRDEDLDGFGDNSTERSDCHLPDGYVPYGDDCDDDEAAAHPYATEICDEIDNDCNGVVDDSEEGLIFYSDNDGDGHGNPDEPLYFCSQPDGTSGSPSDCDDEDAETHLGAEEVCDGADNDCDGTADEDCP